MSLFREQMTLQQGRWDKVYGEPLEIRHVVENEFTGGTLDPEIPPFVVMGILDMPQQLMFGSRSSIGDKAELISTPTQADFDASIFSDHFPEPVPGTLIVATRG